MAAAAAVAAEAGVAQRQRQSQRCHGTRGSGGSGSGRGSRTPGTEKFGSKLGGIANDFVAWARKGRAFTARRHSLSIQEFSV